ncbi:hypothetical protein ZHAS_00010733 [Anopheles sinensis]|uniref:Uncharacterized protein n=1 Tax=Anopheles sinensis TaxID=74873 RepID=A0A084VYL3_ANOSI|nr:hypothetical protein ZHAS_00010733 [Anopheles sinensis]
MHINLPPHTDRTHRRSYAYANARPPDRADPYWVLHNNPIPKHMGSTFCERLAVVEPRNGL